MIIDLSESHGFDGFRSRLEVEVGAELDRLQIHHAYEQPWTDPDTGYRPRYLPDFTIEDSDLAEALRLPKWVEAKPQQFIYDLFGTLGIERRVGRYFTDDVTVTGTDAQRLKDMHVEELWKPKALAELSGEAVLVVGAVGATNRLSVEMQPQAIVFSRSHPFVNQRGEEERAAKEERRRESARRAEEYRRHAEARAEADRQRQAERDAAAMETAADRARRVKYASRRSVTPRFASRCAACGHHGETGAVHRCDLIDGNQQWFRLCPTCDAT